MSKFIFRTDCDYYYRCRIFNVEEAKREYTKCNDFLLGSGIKESPVMKLLADKPKEEKEKIYKAYKKLCDDFKSTAQMLIDKEGIESEEDYIHGMELLMLIANRTIMFTDKTFNMQKKSLLREKYSYDEKRMRLSAIINQNSRIPYILNPDDISTVFADKYGGIILAWTGVIFILVGLLLLCFEIYTSGLQTLESIISFVCWAFFVVSGIYICCMYLWARKQLKYAEKKSKVHSRNQYLVVRPYKNKFTLKNIKEVLDILNYFKR